MLPHHKLSNRSAMLKPTENSAETFFQSNDGGLMDDFSYRAVSRAAVLSTAFSVIGLLSWISPLLVVIPLLAVVFGFVGLSKIKRYSSELTGRVWAIVGLVLGLSMLIAAPVKHAYIYMTEVPEGFERVSFSVLKSPTGAPDFPTPAAMELSGKKIFLKGYIHPTSLSGMSAKTFVLVPDWATCCFGTQPPLTHMIEVRLVNDKFAQKSFRQHSLAGTFEVTPYKKQVDGLDGVYYLLEAEHFK